MGDESGDSGSILCVAGCCRMRERVSVVEHAAVDAFGLCCTSGRADKIPAGREEEDDGVFAWCVRRESHLSS
jgi:hypothetical protein